MLNFNFYQYGWKNAIVNCLFFDFSIPNLILRKINPPNTTRTPPINKLNKIPKIIWSNFFDIMKYDDSPFEIFLGSESLQRYRCFKISFSFQNRIQHTIKFPKKILFFFPLINFTFVFLISLCLCCLCNWERNSCLNDLRGLRSCWVHFHHIFNLYQCNSISCVC